MKPGNPSFTKHRTPSPCQKSFLLYQTSDSLSQLALPQHPSNAHLSEQPLVKEGSITITFWMGITILREIKDHSPCSLWHLAGQTNLSQLKRKSRVHLTCNAPTKPCSYASCSDSIHKRPSGSSFSPPIQHCSPAALMLLKNQTMKPCAMAISHYSPLGSITIHVDIRIKAGPHPSFRP